MLMMPHPWAEQVFGHTERRRVRRRPDNGTSAAAVPNHSRRHGFIVRFDIALREYEDRCIDNSHRA
jgi:hypothetical protein